MRTVMLSLAVVAACGGGKFASSPPPAGMTYKDMNHKQRIYFMEHEVLPQMKAVFVAFDPKLEKFECKTCHGDAAHEGTFKMPNPQLPSLPNSEEAFIAWVSKDAEKARWSKFMAEQVEPKMGELLHLTPFDPKTHTGEFSCNNCHTLKP